MMYLSYHKHIYFSSDYIKNPPKADFLASLSREVAFAEHSAEQMTEGVTLASSNFSINN
jgi:hypothetical protein